LKFNQKDMADYGDEYEAEDWGNEE